MTKTWTRYLLAAVVLLLTFGTEAQTRSGFEIGAELFDYGYRERIEGQTVVRDDGRFFGINTGYTGTFGNGLFIRGRLDIAFGSVDYESDDGETRLHDVEQTLGRLELHAGRDFVLRGGTTITPYIGIANRLLLDESGGEETESGLLGYDREIRYRYIPLGITAGFPLRGGRSLSVTAQHNRLISGRAESHLSKIDPELPDLRLSLDDGSGYELNAMLNLPVRRRTLGIGAFVRAWSIDESSSFVVSDPDGSGEVFELFEPPNRTREAGLRLIFRF